MTVFKSLGLVLVAGLVLTACGQQASKTEKAAQPASKPTSSIQHSSSASSAAASGPAATPSSEAAAATSSSESETAASSEPETSSPANQQGPYFSVPGKYGPVLIVNKKHGLDPSYAPGEDPQAAAAFWELVAAMRAQGFDISDAYSGFRSYDYQASLYQNYVAQDGQANADRYSARPGHSEHQTGLAFDLMDSAGQLLEEPVASTWLANNAHHYGFVVRYLPGKEHITGYMAESWHVRYIGPEAKDIYQSGLTLEEYYGVPGGDYAD